MGNVIFESDTLAQKLGKLAGQLRGTMNLYYPMGDLADDLLMAHEIEGNDELRQDLVRYVKGVDGSRQNNRKAQEQVDGIVKFLLKLKEELEAAERADAEVSP